MKMFKEKAGGGPKYEQAAKGGDLAKGVSHYEGNFKATDMIKQKGPETNQRMPKGSDRI